MRQARFLVVTSALALSGATILASGCGTFEADCLGGKECSFGTGGAGSSSTGSKTTTSTMTSASSMMASSSTGMDPGCTGEITESLSDDDFKRLISDKCGVFVQADATGATEAGTQAAPYKSLQAAIDNSEGGNKRVYACSSAPYAEAVTVAARVEVYGGFTCANGWVLKAATRSLITGAANMVSLTLPKSAEGARIEGFKITSANATDKGASSVAVAVDDITATLAACDIEAGDGADGIAGMAPASAAMAGATAPVTDPLTLNACINQASLAVGAPGTTTCGDGVTDGGAGGLGGVSGDGEAGADGKPGGATGKGGAGQDATNLCAVGTVGAPGIDGGPGAPGAAGDSLGVLSLSGLLKSAASDGTNGKPGGKAQGGGGGGGAKSGVFCPGNASGNGASGGGGGGGGCGGTGGIAGKAGGSSIALVNLGSHLNLLNVTLKSGTGGKGGNGAIGQGGGAGGLAGNVGAASGLGNSKAGCKGGDGGAGGSGGPGGGGQGGHSIGLAIAGTPKLPPTILPGGKAGTGGLVGTDGPPTSNGAPGVAGATCDFSSPTVTCK